MAAAFQPSAFQNDAFQTAGGSLPPFGARAVAVFAPPLQQRTFAAEPQDRVFAPPRQARRFNDVRD